MCQALGLHWERDLRMTSPWGGGRAVSPGEDSRRHSNVAAVLLEAPAFITVVGQASFSSPRTSFSIDRKVKEIGRQKRVTPMRSLGADSKLYKCNLYPLL